MGGRKSRSPLGWLAGRRCARSRRGGAPLPASAQSRRAEAGGWLAGRPAGWLESRRAGVQPGA